MNGWIFRILALFALAGSAIAVPASARERRPAAAQPAPRPAMWLLADEDTKIYLFGTFHILPNGLHWRSSALDEAIRESQELVLEIEDREALADPATFIAPMQLGKQAPLLWRVSPDRREALRRLIAEMGLPIEMFDGMQSWAAVMTIYAMMAVRQYRGEDDGPVELEDVSGVEDVLEEEFRRSGKPISGVETVAQQMGFFRNLRFAEQRQLLESMIDDYARGETQASGDVEDWVRGDAERIAILRSDLPGPLYEALISQRNRAWTDWLIARLDRPGTILFAVGAGHLAGPDSVQTMLRARGFTARRIN